MKNIINIINFVRGLEPREGRNIDLEEPVREQIHLLRENHLRGTFLLQYDALQNPSYTELIKANADICEAGVWLEIVQPLVEKAGGIWRGRYPWDWYNDVGFLIGYEPPARLLLIDEIMSCFRSHFGYYPQSIGCWHLDTVSLAYLDEKYRIKACCICRDQVGADGYTIQGGYYNQAYYPSRSNILCPASCKEKQISVPVFRMLGPDPVFEYDYQVIPYPEIGQKTPTLEPIGLGGDPRWCEWFFSEVFDGSGLSFQYAQVGQENSFGWPAMRDGLICQHALIRRLQEQSVLEAMTLAESGAWYQQTFGLTPASSYTAMNDFVSSGRRSVWYYSRYYRAGILCEHGIVRFRDLYLFDEDYEEHYRSKRCATHSCEFRNLPVMDGVLYTAPGGTPAGLYLCRRGENVAWDSFGYTEYASSVQATLRTGQYTATITFSENAIALESDLPDLQIQIVCDAERIYGRLRASDDAAYGNHNSSGTSLSYISEAQATESGVSFSFNGRAYEVALTQGKLHGSTLSLEKGKLRADMSIRTPNKPHIYRCTGKAGTPT